MKPRSIPTASRISALSTTLPVSTLPVSTLLVSTMFISTMFVSTAFGQTPEPAPEVALSLFSDQSLVLDGDSEAVVLIELQGSDDASTMRAPVTMVVVFDTSGSMAGDKIEHARAAAHELIDRLEIGDVLSILSYDSQVTTHLENFSIGEDRSPAHQAVTGLQTAGNTCISCGLESAYSVLSGSPSSNARRVVLFSDGRANRGITSTEGLNELAGNALTAFHTPTSSIGLGTDYDEALMTSISMGGSGSYYFLPDPESIARILDRELASLANSVASGVAVVLSPRGGAQVAFTDVPGAVIEGDDLIINLGQVAAGELRTFVVTMALPDGRLGEIAEATLTWTPVDGTAQSVEQSLRITRTDDPAAAEATIDPRVIEQQERISAVNTVALALDDLESGDADGAAQRLRHEANRLEDLATRSGSAALAGEAEQLELLADELDRDDDEPAASSEDVREIRLRNEARNAEVLGGVQPDDMYHSVTD